MNGGSSRQARRGLDPAGVSRNRRAPPRLRLGYRLLKLKKRRLVRIPFCFADNVAARTPGWNWASEPPFGSGLKVFNFHPALIALNLGTPAAYARLKVSLGSRRLDQATPDDFSPFANAGPGARIFLERLLESLSPDDCARISDVAAAHAGAVR